MLNVLSGFNAVGCVLWVVGCGNYNASVELAKQNQKKIGKLLNFILDIVDSQWYNLENDKDNQF